MVQTTGENKTGTIIIITDVTVGKQAGQIQLLIIFATLIILSITGKQQLATTCCVPVIDEALPEHVL